MPNYAKKQHYHELERVITMAEACRLMNTSFSTIRYAIDAGNVAAVQCGRVWLVHTQSLIDWFSRKSA